MVEVKSSPYSFVIVSTALTLVVIPLLYYMYLKTVGPENVVDID